MGIERINNNLSTATSNQLTNQISVRLNRSFEQLASGLRINRSGDDAAGLRIANLLQTRIGGLNEAFNQTQSGINLTNVADQALGSINERLNRIRELTLQAGNTGVLDNNALQAIQSEIAQNVDEINRVANTTQFGSTKLLNGDFSTPEQPVESESGAETEETNEGNADISSSDNQINFQLGSEAGQSISVNLGDARSGSLGLGENRSLEDIDITQEGGVEQALEIVDAAQSQISEFQSNLGAVSNRLSVSANALSVASENLLASQSRIQDIDFAEQVSKLIEDRLLLQSNLSVQSQIQKLQSSIFLDLLR